MKNLHIIDSYKVWKFEEMWETMCQECFDKYGEYNPEVVLNRLYLGLCVEWWLHNVCYYVTKPFCFIESVKRINLRAKDVDLEERV